MTLNKNGDTFALAIVAKYLILGVSCMWLNMGTYCQVMPGLLYVSNGGIYMKNTQVRFNVGQIRFLFQFKILKSNF